jgi:hypothetical protein
MMNKKFTDIGESYCVGDPLPEDIDWDQVTYLQERYDAIQAMPEGADKSFAMLELLKEMYGDEMEVL